jgi:hypothetical protein
MALHAATVPIAVIQACRNLIQQIYIKLTNLYGREDPLGSPVEIPSMGRGAGLQMLDMACLLR